MKIGIMQPYIFPYLGYFQLIKAVDVFVFYDDVNFIKRGWINRNKLLVNGEEYMFTIALSKASQNKLINEVLLLNKVETKNQLLKTLKHNYKKAPYFDSVYFLVDEILSKETNKTIADLAINSVVGVSEYLGLNKTFEKSSISCNDTKGQDKADRLINITKDRGGDFYINPIGGLELYNKDYFLKQGVALKFIKNELTSYKQFENQHVKGLSIIDVLMFNSKEETIKLIENYKLI